MTVFFLLSASIYALIFLVLSNISIGGTPLIYRTSDALNWKGGNSYTKFRAFDRNAQYDVVFIGSSHAYRGYDTRVFTDAGYSAFNLGSSAQTPINTEQILRDLVNVRNTKTVIIDVFNGALETDGLESTADLSQNYPSTKPVLNMVWQLKDPRGLNMLMLRMVRYAADPMYTENCNGANGTCLISDSAGVEVNYPFARPLVLKQDQLCALERTIRYLQETGIQVVLADHPIPPEADQARQVRYSAHVKTLAQQWNVPLVDMSSTVGFDSRAHFYDHTHLNEAGAAKFSLMLLDTMVSRGYL
jgi:hypothetical protein